MSKVYSTDWKTFRGSTNYPTIQLDDDELIDFTGCSVAQAEAVFSLVSGCTFFLEGRDRESQEYAVHMTVSATTATFERVFLSSGTPKGSSLHLHDLLRYRVTGNDGWKITFRLVIAGK